MKISDNGQIETGFSVLSSYTTMCNFFLWDFSGQFNWNIIGLQCLFCNVKSSRQVPLEAYETVPIH